MGNVGKILTALTANNNKKKRWRRSTGILVAVALSDLSRLVLGWRCGSSGVSSPAERRHVGCCGRLENSLSKASAEETYLGYVGEDRSRQPPGFAVSRQLQVELGEISWTRPRIKVWQLKRYWIKILKKSEVWKTAAEQNARPNPTAPKKTV